MREETHPNRANTFAKQKGPLGIQQVSGVGDGRMLTVISPSYRVVGNSQDLGREGALPLQLIIRIGRKFGSEIEVRAKIYYVRTTIGSTVQRKYLSVSATP